METKQYSECCFVNKVLLHYLKIKENLKINTKVIKVLKKKGIATLPFFLTRWYFCTTFSQEKVIPNSLFLRQEGTVIIPEGSSAPAFF